MENYFIAVLTGHAMPFLRLYQTLILPLQGVTKTLNLLAPIPLGKYLMQITTTFLKS